MLRKIAGLAQKQHRKILGLLTLLLLCWGGWAWFRHPTQSGVQYAEQALKRGDLAVYVTATGSLQPTNKVDVGSELSGTVSRVLVDYNARIKKGQVLVELDTSKLGQAIDRARASLQAKQAAVVQARATQKEAETALARQEEVFRVSGGKVPSATELDAARAKLDRARADLTAAEANVTESAATLRSNETDLSKATIRSPINGVVLKRAIDPGQTVAASLSAPVLFTLAEDLAEMELIVAVSEADVGQVREGQSAQFTVDAFPGKNYPAQIRQVRFGSKTVDNVVSYETVLTVKNTDLSLRPGMTASADILVNQRKGVLLVPNAALRFKPAEKTAPATSGGILSFLLPRPPVSRPPARASRRASGVSASEMAENDPRASGPTRQNASASDSAPRVRGTVWIKDSQGEIRAEPVIVGASDGKFTEIRSRKLKEGDLVIAGTAAAGKP